METTGGPTDGHLCSKSWTDVDKGKESHYVWQLEEPGRQVQQADLQEDRPCLYPEPHLHPRGDRAARPYLEHRNRRRAEASGRGEGEAPTGGGGVNAGSGCSSGRSKTDTVLQEGIRYSQVGGLPNGQAIPGFRLSSTPESGSGSSEALHLFVQGLDRAALHRCGSQRELEEGPIQSPIIKNRSQAGNGCMEQS